jgi:hypothetical protein
MGDVMRNFSIRTADRTTHLKIVAVALLASLTVMGIGIAARPQAEAAVQPMKPAKAILAVGGQTVIIR